MRESSEPTVIDEPVRATVNEAAPAARTRTADTKQRKAPQGFTGTPVMDLGGRDVSDPEYWEEAASKKKRRGKAKKTGKYAGGRWQSLLVKYAVWATMGMVFLTGFLRIVLPPQTNTGQIIATVKKELGRNNFPLEAGQQLAERFAFTYLTYDPKNAGLRTEQLKSMMINKYTVADPTAIGVANGSFYQEILSGPFLSEPPLLIDDKHTTFVFTAVVRDNTTYSVNTKNNSYVKPRTVTLGVTVFANEVGQVIVAGAPAFMPTTNVAPDALPLTMVNDTEASSAVTPRLQEYLTQWAQADDASPVSDQYLHGKDSSMRARIGLGGSVTLSTLANVKVEALPKDAKETTKRTAVIDVTWTTAQGTSVNQSYLVKLLNENNYWYVLDIEGSNLYDR